MAIKRSDELTLLFLSMCLLHMHVCAHASWIINHPVDATLWILNFSHLLYTIFRSLHSRKLHILGFLASMVWTRSLEIFFLSLSDRGTYHFCNRSFPWRLNSSMNCICRRKFSFKLPTTETRYSITSCVLRGECTQRTHDKRWNTKEAFTFNHVTSLTVIIFRDKKVNSAHLMGKLSQKRPNRKHMPYRRGWHELAIWSNVFSLQLLLRTGVFWTNLH